MFETYFWFILINATALIFAKWF